MGTAYELCQLGCEFDPAMSLHYNALASRQGEPEADMAISKWFLCGHDGVFDKNEQLAYEYAKRAATAGLGTAEFAIGMFFWRRRPPNSDGQRQVTFTRLACTFRST